MNVAVKHNGTTITSRVISYHREHNICTGVGTLTVVLDGTYSASIAPWHEIDIYENGDFKVRYYVSQVTKNAPDGTRTLECQDMSKRLVDYFIPDTYTIDYPSYTRTWIETFLTEAGIEYQFNVASQGNLLSNYTNLGLQSGYDQIMMLLQLSGWYMYFDGDGKAIIGTLDVDLADVSDKFGKRDILNIKKVSNDKMLRNRAVVWGQYDPVRSEYAYADVSKKTPWNYDSRDLRAIVISNNNIPNKSSAYSLANILLKEFTKPTIEKHITLHGARDITLGDAVNINTNIWRGKGLVTTFGVTMDKNGLVTNIILDERCPRLFGFFNFGDYVYVGTFGDGVWRKHIEFDPAWYNFSTGLTNLNITDLHINQDVFGSIGSDGSAYYANSNEGPWNQVTFSSFMNSEEDVTTSGIVTYVPFSGLMARATIVDKATNTVKFGVDTFSGINTGDYFLTYSSFFAATSSGVTTSGYRGWIAEYDPFTGSLVGELGSGIYPVNYSGNYDVRVLDLENDGRNDYVSIALGGGTIGPTTISGVHNFGYRYAQPYAGTKDYTSYTVYPDAESIAQINDGYLGSWAATSIKTATPWSLIAVDNQISGHRIAVGVGADGKCRKVTFTRTFSVPQDRWIIDSSTLTSGVNATLDSTATAVIGIYPNFFSDTYRIFYIQGSVVANELYKYYYIDWNAGLNTFSSATEIGTATSLLSSNNAKAYDVLVLDDTIYHLIWHYKQGSSGGGYWTSSAYLYVDLIAVDMINGQIQQDTLLEFATPEYLSSGRYFFFPANGGSEELPTAEAAGTFANVTFGLFQRNNAYQILGRTEIYHYYQLTPGPTSVRATKEYVFYGTDGVIQQNLIYEDEQSSGLIRRFPKTFVGYKSQLTSSTGMLVGDGYPSSTKNSYTFNGSTFNIYTSSATSPSDIYYGYDKRKILPMFVNNGNKYIAEDTVNDVFSIFSADTMLKLIDIEPPSADWVINGFTSTGFGSFSLSVYASLENQTDFYDYLCPYDFSSFDLSRKISGSIGTGASPTIGTPNFSGRVVMFGNFIIQGASGNDYTVVDPIGGAFYYDIGTPDWDVATFMVLQRNGMDYSLIQQSAKPIRVDISNNSPVLTVLDQENTFISNYVYGNELVQVVPISGLVARDVRDYRYTLLETTSSGLIVASGAGVRNQIVYVTGSGVLYADVETYSGGFLPLSTIPSGSAERIETTNYTYPGQYIFVTTSGDTPTFYQRDNDSLVFVEYSGLPSSRATIIRCDDIL